MPSPVAALPTVAEYHARSLHGWRDLAGTSIPTLPETATVSTTRSPNARIYRPVRSHIYVTPRHREAISAP